ncbi:MAG: hypothetical protein CM1200mP39_29640 [Dehalococcoidia bacterium]|nr:MAG: hypothetical protein CM1200mP39_29640 [Dehalococcoidia bacterium]
MRTRLRGFPDAVQAELRAQAIEVFAQSRSGPVLTNLDDALMIRMMRTCLGEKVPPEYAPPMRMNWVSLIETSTGQNQPIKMN